METFCIRSSWGPGEPPLKEAFRDHSPRAKSPGRRQPSSPHLGHCDLRIWPTLLLRVLHLAAWIGTKLALHIMACEGPEARHHERRNVGCDVSLICELLVLT